MKNATGKMRAAALAAIKAGMSKEDFVSRWLGSMANLAAREYELATFGYVTTPRG